MDERTSEQMIERTNERIQQSWSLVYFIFTFSGSKVVLFCVRADFNGDEVCLSFGGDNGVRSILFNSSIQYPLVQVNCKTISI